MKITRNLSQWQSIIEAQQSSGSTVIDFCRQHNISTSTFYAARKKLEPISRGFVRATLTQEVELVTQAPIELTVGLAKVTLPCATSPSYLAQVLRELAL